MLEPSEKESEREKLIFCKEYSEMITRKKFVLNYDYLCIEAIFEQLLEHSQP